VDRLTSDYWFRAGVMRSFHRYASDLLVVMVFVHLLREFAYDRYRGVRWFSWLTGLPIIWLLYVSGISGRRLPVFHAVSPQQRAAHRH
jgi:quinol-cytochrome oxidoreductase complex cytochrome b subunit